MRFGDDNEESKADIMYSGDMTGKIWCLRLGALVIMGRTLGCTYEPCHFNSGLK